MEETITFILAAVVLVFGILQIILFFKLWGMTNNVKRLCAKICYKEEIVKPQQKTNNGIGLIIVFLIITLFMIAAGTYFYVK